jgi:L-asparaginase
VERVDRTTLVFTTGGTIASQARQDGEVLVDLSGADVMDALPAGAREGGGAEVIELALLPATAVDPPMAFEWARRVEAELAQPRVGGAVVTLGTSAIGECAYLFDLTLGTEKPVVFTGAMRMPGHPAPDGPPNLAASLAAARDERLAGFGVLVVMNGEIHAARDVVKTHSRAVHAFQSPCSGSLGRVADRAEPGRYEVFVERRPVGRERIRAPALEPRVGYVTAVLGCDGIAIDALVDSGVRGIVVETLGEGSTTTAMAAAITRAIDRGVVVVIASRVCGGTYPPLYTDVGESRWLLDRGALFAGTLNGPKARIKLMLALGAAGGEDVERYFRGDSTESGEREAVS